MKQLRPYQQQALDNLKKRLRETVDPLLLNISVGGGKSVIIAELLLWLERFEYRALCLTLNSSLVQQNADTYKLQGGNCGIYCAGLKSKAYKELVIFASPHSICQGIRKESDISRQPFNLIIIDEAHNVSPHDDSSMFMRIWLHYRLKAQTERYNYRIVGLTGTPYRGKGQYIVGPDQFFKEEVSTISAPWLIQEGYLTKPTYGITYVDSIDFKNVHVENTGKFRHKDLEKALSHDERLTSQIMREVTEVLENGKHHGAFIFAATVKHCEECFRALPESQAAIITGDTPHEERQKILLQAQAGDIKYLISVNCLMVGIDVPAYDICVWCRPTESLILYIQGIGRVLRLSPGKERAIILDYAGNIERHGDIDHPIINEALNNVANDDQDYCISCVECETLNKVTARRCRGIVNNKRCDHFFDWKECPKCQTENDITSRECRGCDHELIDPNAKLKRDVAIPLYTFKLIHTQLDFWTNELPDKLGIIVELTCERNNLTEFIRKSYMISTEKSVYYFYGTFIKPFFGSQQYLLTSLLKEKEMATGLLKAHMYQGDFPDEILAVRDSNLRYQFHSVLDQ